MSSFASMFGVWEGQLQPVLSFHAFVLLLLWNQFRKLSVKIEGSVNCRKTMLAFYFWEDSFDGLHVSFRFIVIHRAFAYFTSMDYSDTDGEVGCE